MACCAWRAGVPWLSGVRRLTRHVSGAAQRISAERPSPPNCTARIARKSTASRSGDGSKSVSRLACADRATSHEHRRAGPIAPAISDSTMRTRCCVRRPGDRPPSARRAADRCAPTRTRRNGFAPNTPQNSRSAATRDSTPKSARCARRARSAKRAGTAAMSVSRQIARSAPSAERPACARDAGRPRQTEYRCVRRTPKTRARTRRWGTPGERAAELRKAAHPEGWRLSGSRTRLLVGS